MCVCVCGGGGGAGLFHVKGEWFTPAISGGGGGGGGRDMFIPFVCWQPFIFILFILLSKTGLPRCHGCAKKGKRERPNQEGLVKKAT